MSYHRRDDDRDQGFDGGLIMVLWIILMGVKAAGGLKGVPWWLLILSLPLMYFLFLGGVVGLINLL